MSRLIDTDKFSATLRQKSIDLSTRRLLVTRLAGSEQETDLSAPVNCSGLGRIRHFRRKSSIGWPENPLPMDPACKALRIPPSDEITAQVFQNASCNWRCWYCYVPFSLLNASQSNSTWMSCAELIDLYMRETDRPIVLDLTGGQPDLVPEWVPWMMRELTNRGISNDVYLWSDDNLSNDYFWKYLPERELRDVCEYENYGKVCCFKGFCPTSFSFNTRAIPELFDRQFELIRAYLNTNIDVYAYATFTTPTIDGIDDAMRSYVDRLQLIHPNLPLRVVPLEVQAFSPVVGRMGAVQNASIYNQKNAIDVWKKELEARFSSTELETRICDVCISMEH